MSIQFTRRIKPKAVIDMVPMIDIVFQLVIFFMVATTFKTTTGMELNLPNSQLVDTISTTPIKITIIDADNIFVEDFQTNIDDFQSTLKSNIKKDATSKRSVVIYGNKNVEYQLLIDVMDYLRLMGFESVDLALKKREK